MTATFTRLSSGAWGIRVEAMNAPKPGRVLPVTKKDGSTQDVTVGAMVYSSGGVHLCTIASESSMYAGRRASGKRSSTRRTSSSSSGRHAPGGKRCSYCGSRDCPRAFNPRDLCQED